MRISHRQLEAIRRNPKLAAQIIGKKGGGKSIARYWQFKLKHFHTGKMTIDEVAEAFTEECMIKFNNTPSNNGKIEDYVAKYPSYVSNYNSQGLYFRSFHSRVNFTVYSDNELYGEIFRIDRNSKGGYSITLFWNNQESEFWASELRFPILQKLFADNYRVSTDDVQIGIFDLEYESHEYITFDKEAIEDAMSELNDIIEEIGEIVL